MEEEEDEKEDKRRRKNLKGESKEGGTTLRGESLAKISAEQSRKGVSRQTESLYTPSRSPFIGTSKPSCRVARTRPRTRRLTWPVPAPVPPPYNVPSRTATLFVGLTSPIPAPVIRISLLALQSPVPSPVITASPRPTVHKDRWHSTHGLFEVCVVCVCVWRHVGSARMRGAAREFVSRVPHLCSTRMGGIARRNHHTKGSGEKNRACDIASK